MLPLFLVISLILAIPYAHAQGNLESFLGTNAEAEAEKAHKSGDKRHIVLPTCDGGKVLPGWPTGESPEAWKAIEDGKQPLSCADYGNDTNRSNFMRAVRQAERYNVKLLQIEKSPAK